MKKSITIIGINYYPEDSAIGLYTSQKAEYLKSKGYNVSVITGFPYYPQWKIWDTYKDKNYLQKETINGVTVYRNKQYVPSNPTFLRRIMHMVSFTFGNFINLFRAPRSDIIICIIPFTSSAFLGWLLKLRNNAKLWVHIQDFEFDAAIDSGLLNGNKKFVINLLLWIEKRVLNRADMVSTISHGMISKLKEKTSSRSFYLTNWIDVSLFNNLGSNNHSYLNSKKFKILYSGNIGAKQDWMFFEKVVNSLNEQNDIEVIVVGEGAEKENVLKKITRFECVSHYNLVPFDELPNLLSNADLHVLFQKTEVVDTVMPSKLLGMMASARPSIVTGNLKSEIKTIFEDAECGYYMDGKSVDLVVEKILKLKGDHHLRQEFGNNGKAYVTENYSKEIILDRFVNQLELI